MEALICSANLRRGTVREIPVGPKRIAIRLRFEMKGSAAACEYRERIV
jgi:hypothetical protein